MINCYWFEPKTKTFYGPGKHHMYVAGEYLLSDPFELVNNGWVRLTYNIESKELSVNCIHNQNSIKCIKMFLKNGYGEIDSLFLDINNQCTRKRITGDLLHSYIKNGKIELERFQ